MGGSLGIPTWAMTTLSRLEARQDFTPATELPLSFSFPTPALLLRPHFPQPPQLAELGSGQAGLQVWIYFTPAPLPPPPISPQPPQLAELGSGQAGLHRHAAIHQAHDPPEVGVGKVWMWARCVG